AGINSNASCPYGRLAHFHIRRSVCSYDENVYVRETFVVG
ncbi:unnamed protein product, partial [marine sediment metagenome]